MNIVYKDIIIRDYKEEDIIDGIRWMNEEIAWHEWDAPWESEEDLNNFDAEKYYQKAMEKLKDKKDDSEFRRRFEIDTKYGIHIGRECNSYLNDEEYNWKSASQGGCLHTLGIDICESAYWHKGMVHRLLLLSYSIIYLEKLWIFIQRHGLEIIL